MALTKLWCNLKCSIATEKPLPRPNLLQHELPLVMAVSVAIWKPLSRHCHDREAKHYRDMKILCRNQATAYSLRTMSQHREPLSRHRTRNSTATKKPLSRPKLAQTYNSLSCISCTSSFFPRHYKLSQWPQHNKGCNAPKIP